MTGHTFYQCQNETCRFRFPAATADGSPVHCPQCKVGRVEITSQSGPQHRSQPDQPGKDQPAIELLLDNIRSLFNVGAIFRTADGAGVRRLHLCGITATPEHPKLAKTALGAAEHLPWQYHNNALETAVALQNKGYQLWALEETEAAEPLFQAVISKQDQPVLLIVGNEKAGIDPAVMARCDRIFCLPMLGSKASLNVAVAFGIAIYHLQFGINDEYHQTPAD